MKPSEGHVIRTRAELDPTPFTTYPRAWTEEELSKYLLAGRKTIKHKIKVGPTGNQRIIL